MAKIIVMANQKGGVGKTTSTLCVGSVLQKLGFKVLYIDLDKQCNTTSTLKADASKMGSYEVLIGDKTAKECTQFINDKYFIVSASKQLALIDDEIKNKNISPEEKWKLLDKGIEPVKEYFDFILVDTPPNLSYTTINALYSADYIVITCYADMFSIDAIKDMYEVLSTINCSNKVGGILLTKYVANRNIDKFLKDQISKMAQDYGTKVYETTIRNSVAIVESQYINEDLLDYAPKSNAYIDYIHFVEEVLKDFQMIKGKE